MTRDTEAPERIIAWADNAQDWTHGLCSDVLIGPETGTEPYVHLDLLTAAEARAEAAEARADRLAGLLEEVKEKALCAENTLKAWFDLRKLGHDAVDKEVVNAASGYLRTSRVGGMPKGESDLILGVIEDMARLGLFADLFARATHDQAEEG